MAAGAAAAAGLGLGDDATPAPEGMQEQEEKNVEEIRALAATLPNFQWNEWKMTEGMHTRVPHEGLLKHVEDTQVFEVIAPTLSTSTALLGITTISPDGTATSILCCRRCVPDSTRRTTTTKQRGVQRNDNEQATSDD